jgi:hypothetical protein
LKKQSSYNESIVFTSYVVTEIIAKEGRPFPGSDFVRRCLLSVAEEVCPDKKINVQDVSLSVQTRTRHVQKL